jgi:glutamate synthase (NADPH/NADH) small chain
VTRLECSEVVFKNGRFEPVAGTEFDLDADLVLLAMGFVHPEREGLVEQLGLELNQRGNIVVDQDFRTSVPGVFAAGDAQRGQSLVVWAIADGRKAARAIDLYLTGRSQLETPRVAGIVR